MKSELIDGCFYVEQREWGTWNSYDTDGTPLVTSFTQEDCISATRFYLKQKYENSIDENVKVYSGSVDYKL